MKATQLFITTLKEAPQEAELISHQLMIRAGLIRKIASGIYTYMPAGLKVIRKIENIIREEMNDAEATELLMPIVQPAELWQESGRWQQYGAELLRFTDRHNREFCMGPTSEEIITDIARREIKSYKQLPKNFYHFQTKFRDEIRPRFGVMRSREFIMKDAYSFHATPECLQETYQKMYETYSRIFKRLGLNYRAVAADTGSIGGDGSHEFHVLADSGEDFIAYGTSENSVYAANVELATALPPVYEAVQYPRNIEIVDTPSQSTCEAVAELLNVNLTQTVKTLMITATFITESTKNKKEAKTIIKQPIMICLRGDHQLNDIKLNKYLGNLGNLNLNTSENSSFELFESFEFSDAETLKHFGLPVGFMGPCGEKIVNAINQNDVWLIIDEAIAPQTGFNQFICGANETGKHLQYVNWTRDTINPTKIVDIRNVCKGDLCIDGSGVLDICKGIEVGHIFQLQTKYSKALNANILNNQGKSSVMQMGCYGIGVTRIIGAAIEQNHDEKGIIFPESIAPFTVVLCPLNAHKSEIVSIKTQEIYTQLKAQNIDVLWDNRNERPGVMFADSELMGIPHRITISDKTLEQNEVEYTNRKIGENQRIMADIQVILGKICD